MAKTAFQVASVQRMDLSGCPQWSVVDFIRGKLAHSSVVGGRAMQRQCCRKE